MRGTRFLSAVVISFAASCAGDPASEPPTAPPAADPPTAPPAPGPPATLYLSSLFREYYVGSMDYISVAAWDADGRPTHTDMAVLTSSDSSVITLSAPFVNTVPVMPGGPLRYLNVAATTVGVGSAVIRASLNGKIDSLTLNVVPLPALAPDSTAGLAVDSFTMVESQLDCGGVGCRIYVYAPILELRAGDAPVEILRVRFDVPTATTGWCHGGRLAMAAGSTAQVNDMTQYLWFNGLVVSHRDQPLPPGSAKATILFRTQGVDKLIEATGEIQRNVSNPVYPPSPFTGFEWQCVLPAQSGN